MIHTGFSVRAALLASLAVGLATVPANSQPVLLQIKPQVGDTMRVRLAQQVQMTGVPRGCGNQPAALRPRSKVSAENCADVRDMSTSMEVFSRAIARRSTRDATEMIAITDSVVTTSPAHAHQRLKQPASRAPVEIRVSTDGSVELGAGPASDELRNLFGEMGATLPRKAVAVGEKWVHEMRVPLPDEPGAVGKVRTTLQLDSLSRNGEIAYISMRGALSHDHSDGTTSETSGTLTGTMQLNRRLSWITDTHATIDVWAAVKNVTSGKPMDVHTHVVQSLKVTGSR